MRDKHESGKGDHGDSHLRGGQKEGKAKKEEGTGGNMGAGRSGSEDLGSEKPSDDPTFGSHKSQKKS
ncbi:MAG TPA: hypothetical protein VNM92_01780 [Thermoanaerobaculia bacterium]|nr:hypothetical protein [Thermoanaerobaculia bacterium]